MANNKSLQQQPQGPPPKAVKSSQIRDVWADNLVEEMRVISDVLEEYPYVALDTEFPGVVARPVGSFKNSSEYHYRTVKCNVDMLKIIQIGITFLDEEGHLKPGICTWQFNFDFNLGKDTFAQDSIQLLQTSGIDFAKAPVQGIDGERFGEVIWTSGLINNDEVRWISYHGGFDFAYLSKLLSCEALPDSESAFFQRLGIYFPYLYDIKQIMKECDNLEGGLNAVAATLQIERVGTSHQAGSDSMLTGRVFFKICDLFFERNLDDAKYSGVLWGLGRDLPPTKTKKYRRGAR